MVSELNKRHSRWYEQLVFSLIFQLIAGWLVVAYLPAVVLWDALYWSDLSITERNSLIGVSIVIVFSIVTLRKIFRYPGTITAAYILPTLIGLYALLFFILVIGRIDYARSLLLTSGSILVILCFFGQRLANKHARQKLAVVPMGRTSQLHDFKNASFHQLTQPALGNTRYNGVIADLHANLPAEWQLFLAQCTLARIPVYHYKQIMESLTGKVKLDHLSENQFGMLTPNPYYEGLKRFIDLVAVFITAPIIIPITLLTAIAIRIESTGSALFTQERVGQGGRTFRIYKLRSMVKDSEKDGAQFAQEGDMRVTRIGAVIRKLRIDELPQFWNILKGDMSLIGPRPEQEAFVLEFEKSIPFYSYRHVVKPGITGWAQVRHGYAANADDTQEKIEHDFYYIKNYSLWLDIQIVIDTIRTVLTGFGAR
ncbi:exopolysaccharide biosynthesis polyprenyl glycosylphosphotransferase [Saccharospirillum mangrovi]|uniref:exopolysaccharide biosynthesis polyprenyl glycosylphosphotransferase n=1 Tax=Saccharospirillum mangrovi TaxID=2161747 RepID=UPI000D3A0B36|nr:exopolysaccharide biosynthesis polyprenyl glycosylphosphotransferase [Saccharospirillum mangrovi]